jgi:hypothetical protein
MIHIKKNLFSTIIQFYAINIVFYNHVKICPLNTCEICGLKCNFAGGANVTFCGMFQYLTLFGIVIGYTIAASISMT